MAALALMKDSSRPLVGVRAAASNASWSNVTLAVQVSAAPGSSEVISPLAVLAHAKPVHTSDESAMVATRVLPMLVTVAVAWTVAPAAASGAQAVSDALCHWHPRQKHGQPPIQPPHLLGSPQSQG